MPRSKRRSRPDASATGRAAASALWRKGEESGHVQRLVELRTNCDGAAILLLVEQTGPACHTNRMSCFYLRVEGSNVVVSCAPEADRPEA